MGYGRYDDDAVAANVTARVASGRPAAASYTYDIDRGVAPRKVHADLDPKGVVKRESRDSANHPEAVPIILCLDETGSMGAVIKQIQKSLKPTMSLLIKKGYLPNPHIMVMAIGDVPNGEVAPLQVSQFESDDKIEQALDNVYIEGNGGGQVHESYQNGAYFAAYHTETDHWEKRGAKGYMFIFGDEKNHTFEKHEVKTLIGTSIEDELPKDLTNKQIYDKLKERYHVFFVFPVNSSYGKNSAWGRHNYGDIKAHWQQLLGAECVRDLEDENAAGEFVAAQIGLIEDRTDEDTIAKDIVDLHGAGAKSTAMVKAVLSSVSKNYRGDGAVTKLSDSGLGTSLTAPSVARI